MEYIDRRESRDKKAKGGDAKMQVGGQDKRKDLGGWPLWKALWSNGKMKKVQCIPIFPINRENKLFTERRGQKSPGRTKGPFEVGDHGFINGSTEIHITTFSF